MYSFFAHFLNKKFNIDAHYFLKGGFWLSLTQAITITGGLLTSVLLTHYLTPQDFGVYRYLVGLSALFAAFSLTGLGQSILQTAAKGYFGFYLETIRTNLIYSLTISLVGSVGFLYYFLNGNVLLATGCVAIAILQPIINSFSNTSSYLQGRQLYRDSTLLQLFKIIIITLSSIAAILLTKEIFFLFLIFLLSNVTVNLCGHIFFKPLNTKPTPPEIFKIYKSYAVHTSLRNVIANIANRADSIIVFTQLGAIELAIYTIATLIPEQIKGSFRNLASLLLPKYVQHQESTVLRKGVPKRSLQMLSVLCIFTIVYIIVSPYLLNLIFPKYPDSIFYGQLLALAFPSFVFLIPFNLLQANLEQGKLNRIINIGSGVQILVTLLGVYTFGLTGAIIAKIIARYTYLIITFRYFYK